MIVTALDFETANCSDASICAVGIAVFERGELRESLHWLVRPPKGHGFFREDFIECHGLTWFDVQGEPEFAGIASRVLECLANAEVIVAHNAHFEMRMFSGTMRHFGLAYPELRFLCTLQAARRVWPGLPSHNLGALASHIGHDFQHHDAQADAEAAGRVFLAIVHETGAATLSDLIEKTGIRLHQLPAGERAMPANISLEAVTQNI